MPIERDCLPLVVTRGSVSTCKQARHGLSRDREGAAGFSRRQFLSAALVGLAPKTERPISGRFVDNTHQIGHRLRGGARFGRAQQTLKTPVVIAGGGLAGLSAAWRLHKRGFRDFVLLEMEGQAGGNSRWGENEITRYPWAAHYIPVPCKRATLLRELLEELGVLRDGTWEERFLCHSPQERLFIHGRWQEELEPQVAASRRDLDQYRRFEHLIGEARAAGQFTIPIELGAKPSPLDRISMSEWMRQQGFDSRYLNWYIDYACRDDYGAHASHTSAWAGIHYFASREPDDRGPLTWPEGNGWIIERLLERVGRYVRTNCFVHRIAREGRRYRVSTEGVDYVADAVIFALPTFLAPYVLEQPPPVRSFQYSPWFTANLTLDRLPSEKGLEPAWDNVIFDSPSLGYVVATHQDLRSYREKTVWTYYYAMADGSPQANRALLLEKDWSYFKELILNDLARAHPDIRSLVSRIDVMRMGHAMIRPAVGFQESVERKALATLKGNLLFANSDLSGISIFEEAQYHGVRAAEQALKILS